MSTTFSHHTKLKLLSPPISLKLVAKDVLRQIRRTKTWNQLFIIRADRYERPTRAILITNIMSTKLAKNFLSNLKIAYDIPDNALRDNDQQLVTKILTSLCYFLGTAKQQRFSADKTICWKNIRKRLSRDYDCSLQTAKRS